jgi:SAM-dependent methyltransferase
MVTSEPSSLIPFTAHNVLLPDGSRTIPGEILLEEHPFPQAILRTLDVVFPERAPGQYSAVDLGCLEGGHTALIAQAGFSALGIEGRPNNYERCQFVAEELGLEGLRFACDDVHNLEHYGTFDVTFCSGLLYHLDDPIAFLKTVATCTRKLLILHTHFATDEIPLLFPYLSDLTTNEGVPGRWAEEHPETSTEEEIVARRWASLDNKRSFWVEKRHLLQTLIELGFSVVYEQFDSLHHVVDDNYIAENGRSMFVAVKVPGGPVDRSTG